MKLTPTLNNYNKSKAKMAKIFSVKLRNLRQSYNLSLEDVADKLGISRQSIIYYSMGDRLPSIPILVAIAELFCTSTDFLLGLSNERFKKEKLR